MHSGQVSAAQKRGMLRLDRSEGGCVCNGHPGNAEPGLARVGVARVAAEGEGEEPEGRLTGRHGRGMLKRGTTAMCPASLPLARSGGGRGAGPAAHTSHGTGRAGPFLAVHKRAGLAAQEEAGCPDVWDPTLMALPDA